MIVSFIVAVSDNNAIGRKNTLPWHLPEDLKFFKRTTIGKPVIMGRKTYESLGRPLPGRLNIVLTSNPDFKVADGVLVYSNINEAVERLQQEKCDEGFIIGGGQVFKETMNVADRMYITRVHTTVPDADAFFPDIDHSHWKLVWEEKHDIDEQHKVPFVFQKFERIEL
nr:dihydrofolate reductase [uncultured bacterium]